MPFNSIHDYYQLLEGDGSLNIHRSVQDELVALWKKTSSDADKLKISQELAVYQFPIYTEPGSNPNPHTTLGFPDLHIIEADPSYVISRAEEVKNPRHRAKYNHVLWHLSRDSRYGKTAVDAYTLTLANHLAQERRYDFGMIFATYFKAIIVMCEALNASRDGALSIFLDNLRSNLLDGHIKSRILEFLLDPDRKKNPGVIEKLDEYCREVLDQDLYPEVRDRYLQLLITLSNKLHRPAAPYHEMLGDWNIQQAKPKDGGFGVDHFYRKAVTHYKEAKNGKKLEEATVELEKAKRGFNFKKLIYSVEHPLIDKLDRGYRDLIDAVVTHGESDDIYTFLITTQGLLPKAADLEKTIQPSEGILSMITVINFDINRNVNEKHNGRNRGPGFDYYQLYIQNFSYRWIHKILVDGIKSGKLSAASMISFLKRRSWYGQSFTNENAEGDFEGFSWIDMLTPAIQNFFYQSELDIASKSRNLDGYVLCIDSLVIKFEGLIREFSRILGAQTIDVTTAGTSERISFDKLLANPKILTVVPPDDIAFLKYLFTDQWMNLRNNIAHCFYPASKYSPALMWLLVVALLRMGNFVLENGKVTAANQ